MIKKKEEVIGIVVGLGALVATGLIALVVSPPNLTSNPKPGGCGCSAGKH